MSRKPKGPLTGNDRKESPASSHTKGSPGNQWTKGMASPNPAGRPPGRKKQDLFKVIDPLAAEFIAHDKRTLARREGDKIERIERGQAAIEKLYKSAMENNIPALRIYLERRDAAYRHQQEVLEANLLGAISYRQYWLPKFDHAERRGKPVPTELPHPRDVIINPDGTVDLVGPLIAEDQRRLEEILRNRTELRKMIQLAYAHLDYEGVPAKLETFQKAWNKYNAAVPQRLRENFPKEAEC